MTASRATVVCRDWRDRPAAEIAALVSVEARRWLDEFSWDVAESWSVIEPARASGLLDGLVAVTRAGEPLGWTCFLRHGELLQIAAFTSTSPEATIALLDGALQSGPGRATRGCLLLVPDRSPGLRQALESRGFRLETYRYLSATLPLVVDNTLECRGWRDEDANAFAELLERAYRESTVLRPFAISGEPRSWREYVAQLIERVDCGRFMAAASHVVTGADGRMLAAAMVSRLSTEAAHLMQIAVDPESRRRGIGRALITASSRAAASAGAARMTLLVAAGNTPAANLYRSVGFKPVSAFVAGLRKS